jgi:hypothetical protein
MQIWVKTLSGTRCERVDLPACRGNVGPKREDGTFQVHVIPLFGPPVLIEDQAIDEVRIIP